MARVCGRGVASALAGLLLAATEMAQRTAATQSNPGIFLGVTDPAMYEGGGIAWDNTSPTPLRYDVAESFSGTDLSPNTAENCKAKCESNPGNIGVTLIGFSWYDDTTTRCSSTARPTGEATP